MNLVIGLLLAAGFWWLHHSQLSYAVNELDQLGIDFMNRVWANQSPRSPTRYALIDIDQETFAAWDEPIQIPRTKLLSLVTDVVNDVEARPDLLVIDVDLSARGDALSDGEGNLIEFLKRHDALQGKPPIVVLSRVRTTLRFDEMDNLQSVNTLATSHLSELERKWARPTDVAAGVWTASTHVRFGVLGSGRVRHFPLWVDACSTQPHACTKPGLHIPSVPLMAAALLSAYPTPLESLLQQVHEGEASPVLLGKTFHLDHDSQLQRVVFTIPWAPASGQLGGVLRIHDTDERLVEVRPALAFERSNVDRTWLKNRVAVIGASFVESKDWYWTPLGWMPGALLLINAMQSLGEFGQIEHPSIKQTLVIEAVLLVAMTALFTVCKSHLAAWIMKVLVMVLLIPMSAWWFRDGVWLSFAIPLLVVGAHRFVDQVIEVFS